MNRKTLTREFLRLPMATQLEIMKETEELAAKHGGRLPEADKARLNDKMYRAIDANKAAKKKGGAR